ncbi:MAG TPA: recombination regulator RecX [Albitalea sp.]|jgi:regulatory protein
MRPPLSLKGRALQLLAQREHSVAELRRKLLRHARADADDADGADAAARIEEVIAWLLAHKHLSEERFVEGRVHARAARYGNLRIRQELAQHGLVLGADAARALRDSEFERALQVWQRKYGTPPADAAERSRQSRFLAQRGFSPEVIARVMRRAAQAD